MSSTTTPISPTRFAAALAALPLDSLHAKAAELRNSIAHLEASNKELQSFADEGDRDCREAIEENRQVIGSMEERIELLKREVEGRGFLWEGEKEDKDGDSRMINGEDVRTQGRADVNGSTAPERNRGLGDEELARRLRERMEAENDGEDEGLHL